MKQIGTLGAVLVTFFAAQSSQAIEFTGYGYVKAEMMYDSNRGVTPGSYITLVPQKTLNYHFGLTANATRLGGKLLQEEEDYRIFGHGEIDFWGNIDAKSFTNANNQPNPRMRLAYAGWTQKNWGLSIKGGQMADVMVNFVPKLVHFAPIYCFGHLGYRRPQFVLEEDVKLPGKWGINLQVGIMQPSSATGVQPGYQGAILFSLPSLAKKPIQFKFTGAYGWTNDATDKDGRVVAAEDHQLYVATAGFKLPIIDQLTLQGSVFKGENIKALQGISVADQKENGGNAALNLTFKPVSFNFGAGIDWIEKDGRIASRIAYNTAYYGNVFLDFTQNLSAALEASYWKSSFAENDASTETYSYDNWRYSFALFLNF